MSRAFLAGVAGFGFLECASRLVFEARHAHVEVGASYTLGLGSIIRCRTRILGVVLAAFVGVGVMFIAILPHLYTGKALHVDISLSIQACIALELVMEACKTGSLGRCIGVLGRVHVAEFLQEYS